MIEENVVRAAGASYCMDEVEIVRNIENAGFIAKRRNMHYEILGDPMFRERAIPRHARARGRARRRRHQPPAGDQPLRRPKRRGEEGASHRPLISYRAAWVLPIDGLRCATASSRSTAVASSASAPPVSRCRARTSATSPSCPAWSTPTRTSSCRGCAAACRRRLDAGVGGALMALRQTTAADAARADRCGDRRGARLRHRALVGDITNSSRRSSRCAAASCRAACFTSCSASRRRTRRRSWTRDRGQSRRCTPIALAAARRRAARAVFGVAGAVAGDRPTAARRPAQHPPRRVGRGDEFLRDGTGAWRTLLERLGAWNAALDAAGCGPVEYLDRLGLVDRPPARRARRAVDGAELARLAAARRTW